MKLDKKIIFVIIAVIAGVSIWLIMSLNSKNKALEFRTIPEKSEILQAMEKLSAGSSNYQKYKDTLVQLCNDNPVNIEKINNQMVLNGIPTDNISISEGTKRDSGDFEITSFNIIANNTNTTELDILLKLAEDISLMRPVVHIENRNSCSATITVYGLEYSGN